MKMLSILFLFSFNFLSNNMSNFNCLSLNIYHEARNQTIKGQLAVAYVTLNRVQNGYGDNICEVVYAPFQFSWTLNDDHAPYERDAWSQSQKVALYSLIDYYNFFDPSVGSTYFNHRNLNPPHTRNFDIEIEIEDHVFFVPKSKELNTFNYFYFIKEI